MTGMAPIVQALGWALVDFVWQGTLVALGLAVLLRGIAPSRPSLRYGLASAALALCLALPLAAFIGTLRSGHGGSALPWIMLIADQANHGASGGWVAPLRAWLETRLPLVVATWACVATVLAARCAAGLWWVRSVINAASPDRHGTWQGWTSRLGQAMGVQRPLRVAFTGQLDTPVTAGFWRPVILIPFALASGMPRPLLEALVVHELAHVRRFDYLINLMQGVVETLLFYHPAVWWISRVIRNERELAADDLAARVLGEPRRLALALRELEHGRFNACQPMQAAHAGSLKLRIQRLVRPDSCAGPGRATVGIACAALAGLVLVAAQAATAGLSLPPSANPSAMHQSVRDTHAGANGSGVTSARASFDSCQQPDYPQSAIQAGLEGKVLLSFLVDVRGAVKDGRVLRSSGHRELDQAALDALKRCQFQPAEANGKAIERWSPVMYVWTLAP